MKQDKIRCFTALNHLGNEYETLHLAKKYPIKFFYLENNVRRWSKYSARPKPTTWLTEDEFEWVQYFDPKQYDLAILRCDQQTTDPMLGKSQLFLQLREAIGGSLPLIINNHGCTTWDSAHPEDMLLNGGDIHTSKGPRHLTGMKELVGDDFMVVNSYTAAEHWGFGYPIIHGIDPTPWKPLPKELRVVLPVSPAGLDDYYNRSLCTAIKAAVRERTGLDVLHPNVNISFDGDHFAQYTDFIGRSLISIYPFKDSPMPRSRTEGMFAANCILSSRYHGADEFIEHGVDGFIVPDNPLSYAEAIHYLINDCYREAVQIGLRGREKALRLFDRDRYLATWYHVITEILEGRKPVWSGKKIWEHETPYTQKRQPHDTHR